LKIANIIANTAKNLNAVVVVENLPRKCSDNMIRNVEDPVLSTGYTRLVLEAWLNP